MILLRFEIFSWTLRFLVSSKENILRIIFLMILWPTCIHLFLLLIREIQNSSLGWHSFSEINHPVNSKTLVLPINSSKMERHCMNLSNKIFEKILLFQSMIFSARIGFTLFNALTVNSFFLSSQKAKMLKKLKCRFQFSSRNQFRLSLFPSFHARGQS